MRILHVNHTYEKVSGAESCMYSTIDLFSKDHDVYLFAVGKEYLKSDKKFIIQESNFIVNFFRKFFFSYKINRALKSYIKDVNPDVIHLHNHYKYSASILKAFDGKIPVVQTIHDYGLICPSSWAVTKPNLDICGCVEGIDSKCLQCINPPHFAVSYFRNKSRIKLTKSNVSFLIAPSKKLKSYLDSFGFNTVYLPHFIDLDFWKTLNRKRESGLILYVGALTPNKGIDYLVNAMPEIKKSIPYARLRIIGGGPDKAKLESLCKSLNVGVEFSGKLSHDQILEEYNKAEVLVMPSVWMEQFGMVGIEAMASGLPVVGSCIGGIPDWLVDSETGFLVRPKDSKDIAKKVINVLNDKDLWEEFSANSIKRSKLYNKHDFKLGLEAIYRKVLRKAKI